jgi:hypothetical protein
MAKLAFADARSKMAPTTDNEHYDILPSFLIPFFLSQERQKCRPGRQVDIQPCQDKIPPRSAMHLHKKRLHLKTFVHSRKRQKS